MAATGRLPIHALARHPELPLDGVWDFQLLPSADSPQSDRWETAEVPSLWAMTSDDDRPHYTNVPMPFDEVPPMVPDKNPAGIYRRTFDLGLQPGRRVILHVGAAEGALTVRINGSTVGTSTDSHLAAEFDVSDFVKPGQNTIELAVAKWSEYSYLEDQDQWWMFGLSRSVFIYTVAPVHLADVSAVADFDPVTRTGALSVTVDTTGLAHLPAPAHAVRISFAGQLHELPVNGRVTAPTLPKFARNRSEKPKVIYPPDMLDMLSINAASAPVPPEFRAIPGMFAEGMPAAPGPAGTARLEIADLNIPAWSAENPHLEDVRVELVNSSGEVVDQTQLKVGFRRVRVEGTSLLINGERVLIQGVNRHDFDPRTGRVISPERMLQELSLLKRCNVNAIRCAHYPNDPAFLNLCDELGFYVVDEADIEGHAFASVIADDPRYLTEIVERVARMVIRDRNHPSVISWSLGNETGYGSAHDAAAAWVRRTDPTRPVQYEGAVATDWHDGHAASDLLVPMYPSFHALKAYAEDPRANRPLITCEYAYSQGNSTGGLAEYWELFETRPALQGGFIWEFTDHALDPDGDGRSRYGGDFGDEPNGGPTVLNGIAFADLTPKPALMEARGLFSPVRITSDAAAALPGVIRIRNRRHFKDLSNLRLDVHVETRRGATPPAALDAPDLGPGEERELRLPAEILEAIQSPDALAVSVTVRTAMEAAWAPAGTELSVEQVVLPHPVPDLELAGAPVALNADQEISDPLLVSPPRLSLWRAMTDNDSSFSLDPRFVATGFFNLTPEDVQSEQSEAGTSVITRYRTAFGDEVLHRRTIARDQDGGYVFDEQVTLPDGTTDGLRVGIAFELAPGFRDASWTGLGPWENYPDRKTSALRGTWESPIDDLAVPYVVPQENGTRGGVDRLQLRGDAGVVTVNADRPLHMNVSRYSIAELEDATHWWQLPQESTATIVHLDVAHRGVGTGLLGPDTLKKHRLTDTEYAWRWRLKLDSH
jgi:beta-galactosidase